MLRSNEWQHACALFTHCARLGARATCDPSSRCGFGSWLPSLRYHLQGRQIISSFIFKSATLSFLSSERHRRNTLLLKLFSRLLGSGTPSARVTWHLVWRRLEGAFFFCQTGQLCQTSPVWDTPSTLSVSPPEAAPRLEPQPGSRPSRLSIRERPVFFTNPQSGWLIILEEAAAFALVYLSLCLQPRIKMPASAGYGEDGGGAEGGFHHC